MTDVEHTDLDPLLKRLHLANARRVWRDLARRAEQERWSYEQLLLTLFAEEVAHRPPRRPRGQVDVGEVAEPDHWGLEIVDRGV